MARDQESDRLGLEQSEPEDLVVNEHWPDRRRHPGQRVNLTRTSRAAAPAARQAKDQHAPCAIGPLSGCRPGFSLDDVRQAGRAGSNRPRPVAGCAALSDLSKISRDPNELVAQCHGKTHQYPTACVRTGTLFAPTSRASRAARLHPHGGRPRLHPLAQDRHVTNKVNHCDKIPRWDVG